MYPILFKIGRFPIHAYGFTFALAFLVATLTSMFYAKKEGIKTEHILDLAVYTIIAAVVGARLFYVIGTWEQYKDNLLKIFYVHEGGLVFLGGFFLGLLVVVVFAKWKGIAFLKLLDALVPGTAIGAAIGRIGCFLNGCCFGLPTELPWGIKFPLGSLAHSYFPDVHIHPTQLYSSAALFLVFLIVLFLYRKKKFDGYIFFWWIILYSIYRFLVEFLRFSPIHWLGLTPSQWMVLAAAALAVWGLVANSSRQTEG